MHKGNIMKFTEGAFKDWGYELAKAEFRDQIVTEDEVYKEHGGKAPAGKVVIKDRIADSMFQQIQLRPDEYSVIATPNLNGDYFQRRRRGADRRHRPGRRREHRRPGGHVRGDARHRPEVHRQEHGQPGAVLLSGVLMLEHMHWFEAAELVNKAVEKTFAEARRRPIRGPARNCT